MTRRLIVRGPGQRGPAGRPGEDGQDGLPGVNAVPADEAIAGYVTAPSSQTSAALSATFAPLDSPAFTGEPTVNGEPIGSGGGSASSGSRGRGWSVPAGSLDVWRAARDNAADELVEIAVFGDSTTYGSCFDAPAGSEGVYSWTQRLRALIAAEGYPNGGRGVVSVNDNAGINPDGNFSGVQSNPGGGFSGQSNQGPLLTDTAQSTTANAVITFVGKGTAIRLLYGIQGASGGFSYSIDGGPEVTVDPIVPPSGFGGDAVIVGGLTDTTHTVAIKNLGGSVVNGPTAISDQGGTTGAIPAGSYYYRATYVTPSGETTLGTGVVGPISVDGSNGRNLFVNASGYTSVNLYRSTSPNSGFKRVATAPAQQNTFIADTGAAPGADAPTVNTAGRLSANKFVSVTPQFLRSTGIVVNKYGISGITTNNYFTPTGTTPGGSWQSQLALGLTPGLTHGGGQADPNTLAFSWAQPEAEHPKYPRVRLTVNALGINDMQGITTLAQARDAMANITNNDAAFYRMARSAGADPLRVVPHLNIAQGGDLYAGMFQSAIVATAEAYSVPWVDFNEAVGPIGQLTASGQTAAVHADIDTYNREAEFLWVNAARL